MDFLTHGVAEGEQTSPSVFILSDLNNFIALILFPYEQYSVLKNISESVIAIVAPLGTVLSIIPSVLVYAIRDVFLLSPCYVYLSPYVCNLII